VYCVWKKCWDLSLVVPDAEDIHLVCSSHGVICAPEGKTLVTIPAEYIDLKVYSEFIMYPDEKSVSNLLVFINIF
jgi:hypothetical protein